MAQAKPYCIDCVANPALTAGLQGQCLESYDAVDACMKAHKGNVADCVPEWKLFRDCFDKHKVDRSKPRAAAPIPGAVPNPRAPSPMPASQAAPAPSLPLTSPPPAPPPGGASWWRRWW